MTNPPDPQQPGQYPQQQPGQHPQQQPGQYPQQQQPGQHSQQPGQYPQQEPGHYAQQPGQYPQQPGQYPQQPGGQSLPSAPPPPPGYGYGEGGAVPPGYWYHAESGLTLPHGVELASRGRRVGAYFLAIPLAIVTLVIGYLIWGLILWKRGTSPALKVLGMKVWKPDTAQKATFGTMALRDIVGTIVTGILSIVTELTSFIMFLAGKQRKTLSDTIASTVVLYDPNDVLG